MPHNKKRSIQNFFITCIFNLLINGFSVNKYQDRRGGGKYDLRRSVVQAFG